MPSEESPHEQHDLHPGDEDSHHRKRFHECAPEGDEVVPYADMMDGDLDPIEELLHQIRLEDRDDEQSDRDGTEKYVQKLYDSTQNLLFQVLHRQ